MSQEILKGVDAIRDHMLTSLENKVGDGSLPEDLFDRIQPSVVAALTMLRPPFNITRDDDPPPPTRGADEILSEAARVCMKAPSEIGDVLWASATGQHSFRGTPEPSREYAPPPPVLSGPWEISVQALEGIIGQFAAAAKRLGNSELPTQAYMELLHGIVENNLNQSITPTQIEQFHLHLNSLPYSRRGMFALKAPDAAAEASAGIA